MPSVLEQKFKISFVVSKKHEKTLQKYLEENLGGRTYYLHSRVGGKQWSIQQARNNTIEVSINDESLASFIALKFS